MCVRVCGSEAMFAVVWISFVGLFYTGSALHQHTRHERTRYVSSRNQIYGENFGLDEKYIPFVHFWEKPLQVLESSMKIPKKLSSRPLFSWDIPVQMSTYTPSKKISTTENPVKPTTEYLPLSREPNLPDTETNSIPDLPKMVQRSRSDRAKASVVYPDSYALIPTKKKKSGNRKKSIEESEKWNEFSERKKTSVKLEIDGRLPKRKKPRKNRKGKSEKSGKRRKTGRINEMNDHANDVSQKVEEYLKSDKMISIRRPETAGQPPCEAMEEKCEHGCRKANGTSVCVCFRGFTPEGRKCVDVNECETNNGGCNSGKCVNTIGSRKCICSAGFRLVDGVCADVNECLLRNGHGPCQDQCINTEGSYYCSCNNLPGTSLSSDKHTCEDDRNCNASAGCSHTCINLSGRTFCTCPDGLELGSDWKTCHDIDECLNPEDHDVRCEFGCVNTLGSYSCADRNETSSIENGGSGA